MPTYYDYYAFSKITDYYRLFRNKEHRIVDANIFLKMTHKTMYLTENHLHFTVIN